MVKSKLIKESLKIDKDKSKIITGRIQKVMKNPEISKMKKLQVKLPSPSNAQKRNLENLTSATPFSKKSMITSTPFNAGTNKPNGKKLPIRLPLSPIFSNTSNKKESVENVVQSAKDKRNDIVVAKENPPKSEVRVSKAIHENADPMIRTGTRNRTSFGVRKITPAPEKPAPVVVNQNKETRTSRQRDRLPKRVSSIETISSDSEASESVQGHAAVNHNNQSFRSCIFSDSSCSPDTKTGHGKNTEKASLSSEDQPSLVKRLQSDWSSSSFGEKTVLENSRKTTSSQQVRQNKCSKLRVRLRETVIDTKMPSSDVNPKGQKSSPDNTLVNQLKSDWTCTSFSKIPDLKQTPKDNQIQKKQLGKRLLTPLIEMSVENTTILSDTLTATPRIASGINKTTNNNEEEYSSSAEFQSDDEMNTHSRSKRAPTWRELLNKTNESSGVKEKTTPEVRLKRMRALSSKNNKETSPPKKENKSQQNAVLVANKENSQKPVDPVVQTSKDTPMQETHARRSKRLSYKNDRESSSSPEKQEKKLQQKETHDKSGGDEEDRENSRNRKKERTDPIVATSKDAPLHETKARRSKRLSYKRDRDSSLSPEKQEKEKHDNSTGDKEDIKNNQNRKKKKTDPVVATSKDVLLQETHTRRSKRISSKNDREASSSPEKQEKKSQQKEKHDRNDDKVVPVDKKTKGNNQNRKKKATAAEVSSNVPLQETQAKKSKRLSSKSATDPVISSEMKAQKPQQKEKQNTGLSKNGQVERSTEDNKVLNDNKEIKRKRSNENKKRDVAIGKTPLIETEKQMQISAENIDACEKTMASSSPQQNISETLNSSPTRHDETENKTIDLTCPMKFFHSRSERTISPPKPTENLKRRRSSKRKKQDNIYEFLSQSSSDSNHPVDEVIQKMIKTGKVVVAKHKKGTGTMTLPRNRPQKKKVTKVDKISAKTTKPLIAAEKKQPLQERIQDDFDDGLHFDDGLDFNDDDEVPEEDHVRDQRGFSNLARSAMIKQAGRIQKPLQRKPITDKKKLLAMAMQFVSQSTPVRMTPQSKTNTIAPQFSPMPGNKSPWRVDDDKLPNAFYLGRNSDNLPSFSSDYIPMTPSKNKSKSLSSFSSNDSNGENTAPPGAKTITNEASLQALSNTRKALNYRSPLKAINIIEVVNLPPLALHSYGKFPSTAKSPSKNNSKGNALNSSPIYENISNHSSNHSSRNVSNENAENQFENTENTNSRRSGGSDASNSNSITNLFGFDELIDDDNNLTNITIDKNILPNKENLKERLQRLKQLRPNQPVIISDKTNRIKPVFDNVAPMQKTIKQMLCSTMIDNNQHNRKVANHSFNESEDLSNLFKDLEPETTFDDSNPRRTYNRPFKRKRKMYSDYAMFMDSDVSEDEEEANARPAKNYKAKPKKRQKKNPDLNKFVNEFNEMCKEVSQYELVVE